MGKVIGFGLVALVFVACSSKDDAKSEPTGPCADRSGKYTRHLVERDGTCGPVPEAIVTIVPPNPLQFDPDACSGKASPKNDNCRTEYDVTCPGGEGYTVQFKGVIDWSEDGTTGTGVEQGFVDAPSGEEDCIGTYDVTYTKL